MDNRDSNNPRSILEGLLLIAILLFLGLIVALLGQSRLSSQPLTASTALPSTPQAAYPAPPSRIDVNASLRSTSTPTPLPTPGGSPTLEPTISNQPAYPAPPPPEAQRNGVQPTPDFNAPYLFSNEGIPAKLQPKEYAPAVDMIIIGTVTRVYPARWTTSDGKRPVNPFAPDNKDTIYTPIEVTIVDTLKGSNPDKTLFVFAIGGQVGQDIVSILPPRNDFKDNDRVVLFLSSLTNWKLPNIRFQISEYYKVDASDQAMNTFQTIPLQQIRDQLKGLGNLYVTPAVKETSVATHS